MNWIQIISRRPRLLAMIFAALAAMAAVGLAYAWSEQQRTHWQDLARPKGGVEEVLVFSKSLEAGDVLSPKTLAVRVVQKSLLPAGVYTPDQFTALQGQRLAVRVQKGELLLSNQIAVSRPQDSVAMARPGFRLIPMDRTSAQMNWSAMTPRDRVDVWALGLNPEDLAAGTHRQDGFQREPSPAAPLGARPIAMSLRVLSATGQNADPGAQRMPEAPAATSYFLELPEGVVSSYLSAVAGSQVRYVLNVNGVPSPDKPLAKPAPVEILIHHEGSHE